MTTESILEEAAERSERWRRTREWEQRLVHPLGIVWYSPVRSCLRASNPPDGHITFYDTDSSVGRIFPDARTWRVDLGEEMTEEKAAAELVDVEIGLLRDAWRIGPNRVALRTDWERGWSALMSISLTIGGTVIMVSDEALPWAISHGKFEPVPFHVRVPAGYIGEIGDIMVVHVPGEITAPNDGILMADPSRHTHMLEAMPARIMTRTEYPDEGERVVRYVEERVAITCTNPDLVVPFNVR